MRTRDFFCFCCKSDQVYALRFGRNNLSAMRGECQGKSCHLYRTATVSGTLSPVGLPVITFAGATLILTGTGDTANVTNGPPTFLNNLTTATFFMGGVGAGTFTNPFHVFDNQTTNAAGFSDNSPLDLLFTTNAAFASHALSTSIGPITGSSSINSGASFPTTAGALVINSVGTTATFTATVSAVPLPGALPLFATGLAGLGLLGWRRK